MKTPEMTISVPDEDIRLMYHDGVPLSEIADAIGCCSEWPVYQVITPDPWPIDAA